MPYIRMSRLQDSRKDKQEIWVLLRARLIRDEKGAPVHLEGLLTDIHHRVKNNLQIVSSLLDLQTDVIIDDHARGYFLESRNRIQAMAMIHEMLYQTNDLVVIDLARYLERLSSSYSATVSPGTCSFNIPMMHSGVTLA
jgi:two-component sensor histidine kinase